MTRAPLLRRLPARLARDRRGVSVVEFAIVVPVLTTLLLGLSDLLYQGYVQSVLEGAVVKAGRDSALEVNAAATEPLDRKVRAMVTMLGPDATFVSARRSYASFALVKAEAFNDRNGNGKLDKSECFDDVNGNGKWDTDPGIESQGGANDVTRYTMTVAYPRLFPVSALFGWPAKMTVSASTLLKNQPYRVQTTTTIQSVCL